MKARHVLISLMCLPLLLWGCEDETVTSEGCNPDVPAMMYAAGPDGSIYVAPPAGEEGPMGCLELADFGFNNYNWNAYISDVIALDSEGNLYAVAVDTDSIVKMAYSKDKGVTWSTPVVVSAPGKKVFFSAMAVKEPGTLAVAYYGSGDGSKWNGYIAETTNAFDENPVFWSVTANDPADQLHPDQFSTGWFGAIWGMDINEEIHMKYAPNGDVWVSFMKEMCNQRSQCVEGWDYEAHGNSRFQGAAGRLMHQSLAY